ncbi:hypothetical protein [Limnoglobus roseus]|uniref:DUF4157 domain-containing protein n=1 Tax=Limnoglobus roseus TaxID=2598579 RepID=A0A5C1ABP0_9BACT|nr:hypothetical protein [Limnoglobus roseus]QEL15617.1 hypothetical protein PX52LOC_02550 [Limnoglobus roseus]
MDMICPPTVRPVGHSEAPEDHLRDGRSPVVAMASGHGFTLRFRAGAVDHMPENVVADLIAHELAHVEQSAIGIEDQLNDEWNRIRDEGESDNPFEIDADDRMENWGFDPNSVDLYAWEQIFPRRS